MAKIDPLVKDFLAQEKVAMWSASQTSARQAATWPTANSRKRAIL